MYQRNNISREMEISTLKQIIHNRDDYKENSESGLSILLNGNWGSGKTRFINDFKLSNADEYTVLDIYNSFEYDFYENPFIPFFSFLEKQLEVGIDVNKIATITAKHAIRNAVGVSTIVLKQILEKTTGIDTDKIKDEIKEIANEYNNDYDAFNAFNELESIKVDIKTKIKEKAEEKPIILIIDELDRCNPKFAIGTLEILKHFLDIENLIIIAALDKSQLQESVKTIYGQGINSDIYFSKFFDYQFDLLHINFKDIVNLEFENRETLNAISQVLDYFSTSLNISIRDVHKILIEFIAKYKKYNSDDVVWTSTQSVFVLFMIALKNIDLMFYNSILNRNSEYYKQILENSSDASKKKYLKILDYKIDNGINNINRCIHRLELHFKDEYISTEKYTRMPYAGEPHNIGILRDMYFFVPQVVEGKTYLENLLMILNN